jgi:hypothetical protein
MVQTDVNGCMDSAAVGITITVNPLPVVTISGDDEICIGESTTLTGTVGVSHQWYLNGSAIIGATSSTYAAASAGVYNMVQTNSDGCSDSAAVGLSLLVHPLPAVNYVETQDTVCHDAGTITLTAGTPASGTYTGTQVTGNTFNATAAGPGTYIITYHFTDVNGCTDSASSQIVVELCGGVGTVGSIEVGIHPNPFSESAILTVKGLALGALSQAQLRITNLAGEVVQLYDVRSEKTVIGKGDLAAGMYNYELLSAGKAIAVGKVVVVK